MSLVTLLIGGTGDGSEVLTTGDFFAEGEVIFWLVEERELAVIFAAVGFVCCSLSTLTEFWRIVGDGSGENLQ